MSPSLPKPSLLQSVGVAARPGRTQNTPAEMLLPQIQQMPEKRTHPCHVAPARVLHTGTPEGKRAWEGKLILSIHLKIQTFVVLRFLTLPRPAAPGSMLNYFSFEVFERPGHFIPAPSLGGCQVLSPAFDSQQPSGTPTLMPISMHCFPVSHENHH